MPDFPSRVYVAKDEISSTFIIFDVFDNKELLRRTLPSKINAVSIARIAKFGKRNDTQFGIVIGCDMTINVYDIYGKELLWTLTGDVINTITVSNSNEMEIIVGSEDGYIRKFCDDELTLEWETGLPEHLIPLYPYSFAFLLKSGLCGVCRTDKILWKLDLGENVVQLSRIPPDLIIFGFADGTVQIYQTYTGELLQTLQSAINGSSAVFLMSIIPVKELSKWRVGFKSENLSDDHSLCCFFSNGQIEIFSKPSETPPPQKTLSLPSRPSTASRIPPNPIQPLRPLSSYSRSKISNASKSSLSNVSSRPQSLINISIHTDIVKDEPATFFPLTLKESQKENNQKTSGVSSSTLNPIQSQNFAENVEKVSAVDHVTTQSTLFINETNNNGSCEIHASFSVTNEEDFTNVVLLNLEYDAKLDIVEGEIVSEAIESGRARFNCGKEIRIQVIPLVEGEAFVTAILQNKQSKRFIAKTTVFIPIFSIYHSLLNNESQLNNNKLENIVITYPKSAVQFQQWIHKSFLCTKHLKINLDSGIISFYAKSHLQNVDTCAFIAMEYFEETVKCIFNHINSRKTLTANTQISITSSPYLLSIIINQLSTAQNLPQKNSLSSITSHLTGPTAPNVQKTSNDARIPTARPLIAQIATKFDEENKLKLSRPLQFTNLAKKIESVKNLKLKIEKIKYSVIEGKKLVKDCLVRVEDAKLFNDL
ncbi:Bardet-Biedl syndrome 2 protein [Nowakowskiella sp. JEL0407]|nr:Bardet-Biedl syndrome 2 protein [Nowakowskiella sp. JEL0407]